MDKEMLDIILKELSFRIKDYFRSRNRLERIQVVSDTEELQKSIRNMIEVIVENIRSSIRMLHDVEKKDYF